MKTLFLLAGGLLALPGIGFGAGRQYPYTVEEPAEVMASIRLRAPGADWAVAGKESALVTITVDGRSRQHVMLFAGDQPFDYKVFLGLHRAGKHTVEISRKLEGSAHEAEVEILGAEFQTIGKN